MSYVSRFENEYKNYKVDFIELLDEVEEGRLPVLPDMRAELDEVYAQAAKADEYEAKAEALDAIMREWEDERMTKSHILETIQKYYNKYESGDYDAKK